MRARADARAAIEATAVFAAQTWHWFSFEDVDDDLEKDPVAYALESFDRYLAGSDDDAEPPTFTRETIAPISVAEAKLIYVGAFTAEALRITLGKLRYPRRRRAGRQRSN